MYTRWMHTAVHIKSQSDANAVLYHGYSATSADTAAFCTAGTNTQETHSRTCGFVRTPTNMHSQASYTKIRFTVSCQIYASV